MEDCEMYQLANCNIPALQKMITEQMMLGMEYLGLGKSISETDLDSFISDSEFLSQYRNAFCIKSTLTFTEFVQKKLKQMYIMLSDSENEYVFDEFQKLLLFEIILQVEIYSCKREVNNIYYTWEEFYKKKADLNENKKFAKKYFSNLFDEAIRNYEPIDEEDDIEKFKVEINERINNLIKVATNFINFREDIEEYLGLIFDSTWFTYFYDYGLEKTLVLFEKLEPFIVGTEKIMNTSLEALIHTPIKKEL